MGGAQDFAAHRRPAKLDPRRHRRREPTSALTVDRVYRNGGMNLQALSLDLLQPFCRPMRFEAGEMLRRKGRYYRDMFLLSSGCIEIDREVSSNAPNPIISLPGCPIGEIAFLRGCSATASVIAKTPGTALIIDDATLVR